MLPRALAPVLALELGLAPSLSPPLSLAPALVLWRARSLGLATKPESTSFYVGRETVLPRGRSHMAYWRKVLFRVISRNARATTDFFSIPPGRVVELGMQIDL